MQFSGKCSKYHDFNPRSREGSDNLAGYWSVHIDEFQSTLPRGERPYDHFLQFHFCNNFNPRSREGSDYILQDFLFPLLYFNPRSREGSDDGKVDGIYVTKISIHAPARGATPVDPVRERSCPYFNPRSREGSDDEDLFGDVPKTPISIHAPARGATQFLILIITAQKFQSTLPRGERRYTPAEDINNVFISIHAPARGATVNALKGDKRRGFQSTLPRGERRRLRRLHHYFNGISIHAPARGATSAN